MKTFKELKEGDYIYCIFLDDKTVEITQINSICFHTIANTTTINKGVTIFICNKVLSFSSYTMSVFCFSDIEMDRYEKVEHDTYITTDENAFTEHLKQITDENF